MKAAHILPIARFVWPKKIVNSSGLLKFLFLWLYYLACRVTFCNDPLGFQTVWLTKNLKNPYCALKYFSEC